MYLCVCSVVSNSLQPHGLLCLPGFSVHGNFQAIILEWVAISYSRDLPNPGIKPTSFGSPSLPGRFFTSSATLGALNMCLAPLTSDDLLVARDTRMRKMAVRTPPPPLLFSTINTYHAHTWALLPRESSAESQLYLCGFDTMNNLLLFSPGSKAVTLCFKKKERKKEICF